jgi:hypothetical protein
MVFALKDVMGAGVIVMRNKGTLCTAPAVVV